jgi:acyl carrier protein
MDLRLIARPLADGMEVGFEYCTDLFKPQTVHDLLESYQQALATLVDRPQTRISQFPSAAGLHKTRQAPSPPSTHGTSGASWVSSGRVRVNGSEVDLSEIQSALSGCAGVSDCLVVACPDQHNTGLSLIAFVVGPEPLSTLKLRRALRPLLPQGMLLSAFVQLEAIPRTASGQPDSDVLQSVYAERFNTASQIQEDDPVSRALRRIWQDALGVPAVRPTDNFFDLGGNSLLVVRVISEIEHALGVRPPFNAFINGGFAQLAALCARESTKADEIEQH